MARDKFNMVIDELERCGKLMAVWVILKGGQLCGKIVARPSSSRRSTRITLEFYPLASKSRRGLSESKRIAASHVVHDVWGYDRVKTGLAEVLEENRDRLKADFGIELSSSGWNIMNTWEQDMKSGGYDVIRAI